MSVLLVTTFLALLALGALAGALLLVPVNAIGGADALRAVIGHRAALGLAAMVAVTAMAGSLYLSEVAGFVPCALCWYQRIAMYPLAILLPIAAARGDGAIRPYAATLAGIGAVIAGYHVLVQRLPGLPSGSCSLDAPCTAIYVERFGFVTIPVMALIGFVTILALLFVTRERRPTEDPT
jgi:disulfide bond formation protein DsbB